MLGTYALSAGYYDAYYLKAQKVRTLIKGDFDAAFEQVDALVAPTSPTVAFPFGARLADPVAMYLSDACTLPVNVAGLPGHLGAVRALGGPARRAPVHRHGRGTRRRLFQLGRAYEAITADAPRGGAWSRPTCRELATTRATPDAAQRRRDHAGPARQRLPQIGTGGPAIDRYRAGDHRGPTTRSIDQPRRTCAAGLRLRTGRSAWLERVAGAAVGHPQVLRRDRHDARRDQPGRRRARLHHAAADRRGGRPLAARGADPLHQQLRDARAAPRAGRSTSSACTASRYDPESEILHHRRRVGGRRRRVRGRHRSRRRGHPPRAVVRRLHAGDRLQRRRAVHVRDDAERRLALDAADVEAAITPRTKALFLGYPCNPTGAVLAAGDAARRSRDIAAPPRPDRRSATRSTTASSTATTATSRSASLPGMRERTILLGGFSKAYAMTGWRVGYACAPRDLLEGMLKVHQYEIMSAPTTAQDAAVVALDGGRAGRGARWSPSTTAAGSMFVDGLNRIGLPTFEPKRRLLRLPGHRSQRPDQRRSSASGCCSSSKVAVIPGSAFGPSGEGHVRACSPPATSSSRRRWSASSGSSPASADVSMIQYPGTPNPARGDDPNAVGIRPSAAYLAAPPDGREGPGVLVLPGLAGPQRHVHVRLRPARRRRVCRPARPTSTAASSSRPSRRPRRRAARRR